MLFFVVLTVVFGLPKLELQVLSSSSLEKGGNPLDDPGGRGAVEGAHAVAPP